MPYGDAIGRRDFLALAGAGTVTLPFIFRGEGADAAIVQAPSNDQVYVHEITMATPEIMCVEIRDPPIKRGAFIALKKPDNRPYDRWLVRPNPARGDALDYCRVIGPSKTHLTFPRY